MYQIIRAIDLYPHVVLTLVNITTGEKRYWCFSVIHEEELCKECHVKTLEGVLLDKLPQNGGWFDWNDIKRI